MLFVPGHLLVSPNSTSCAILLVGVIQQCKSNNRGRHVLSKSCADTASEPPLVAQSQWLDKQC